MPYRDPARPPSLRDGACPKCLAEDVAYVPHPVDRSVYHDVVHHRSLVRLDQGRRFGGEEEAFFCRACGFVEFYLRVPADVPVDGVHVIPWRPGADGQVAVPRVAADRIDEAEELVRGLRLIGCDVRLEPAGRP